MIQRIVNYFTASYQEVKKVVWPNRQTVISHTVIVVITIAVAMGVIALLDLGLTEVLRQVIYK